MKEALIESARYMVEKEKKLYAGKQFSKSAPSCNARRTGGRGEIFDALFEEIEKDG